MWYVLKLVHVTVYILLCTRFFIFKKPHVEQFSTSVFNKHVYIHIYIYISEQHTTMCTAHKN